MSAVAKLLRDSDTTITGSDEAVYPPISTLLEKEHIPFKTPYAASNIPKDVELIVIGKNAKLVPETNEEVAAAYASGIKTLSFPEVLGELSEGKENLIVVGSYGKSTSTALLAHCLQTAGVDPSFFIGASPLSPHTNANIGKGNIFVMEGDEYPSSNTDSRSKFLHLHPSHLLVTPLAHDHVNIFATPEDYIRPFIDLVRLVPQENTVVVCTSGVLSAEYINTCRAMRGVVTYGVNEGDYIASNIVWGEHTTFTMNQLGTPLVSVAMSQLGEHNIENVVGVAALLFSRQLVTPEQFAQAVKTFKGITRRLDRKSEHTSIPIFEGFGSSHEKARSAIAAMKRHFPERRLVIIFEPHTFSWRNRAALSWYDDVFEGASLVLVYEPASQGQSTHEQSTHEEIVERVRATGIETVAITEESQALKLLEQKLEKNDCILLLSSGNLGGLIESVPRMAEKKFPN